MKSLRMLAAAVAVLVECGEVDQAIERLRTEMDEVWDDGFREGLVVGTEEASP